jgi:hypothetical protein
MKRDLKLWLLVLALSAPSLLLAEDDNAASKHKRDKGDKPPVTGKDEKPKPGAQYPVCPKCGVRHDPAQPCGEKDAPRVPLIPGPPTATEPGDPGKPAAPGPVVVQNGDTTYVIDRNGDKPVVPPPAPPAAAPPVTPPTAPPAAAPPVAPPPDKNKDYVIAYYAEASGEGFWDRITNGHAFFKYRLYDRPGEWMGWGFGPGHRPGGGGFTAKDREILNSGKLGIVTDNTIHAWEVKLCFRITGRQLIKALEVKDQFDKEGGYVLFSTTCKNCTTFVYKVNDAAGTGVGDGKPCLSIPEFLKDNLKDYPQAILNAKGDTADEVQETDAQIIDKRDVVPQGNPSGIAPVRPGATYDKPR